MSYLPIKDIVHPSQKSTKLDKLTDYCKKNQILFVDDEFPPQNRSLFCDPPHAEYKGQFNNIVWKRARELFGEGQVDVFKGISASDIRQGSLGNCYFLCSLASLAEQPELITRLFDVQKYNENGVYSVWLNINGGWQQFVVDEYFPSVQKGQKFDLAFSKTDQKELWVILLEKAYAKAYGSYWDIVGGDPVHALRDLTGTPYDRIEDFSDLDKAWEKLMASRAQKFIITCFTYAAKNVEEQSDEGLVSGHAYSILDVREILDSRGRIARILKIRNPWGKFEWNGGFSDQSPLWTEEAKRELKVEQSDDGVFWMPFKEFTRYFEGIGILKTIPGYVSNSVLINRTPESELYVVRMSVSQQTQITISVDQIDARIIDNQDYSYSYFRLTIGRLIGKNALEFVDCIISPERDIFIENNLSSGDYILLIEAYWYGKLADSFMVGTYSNHHVELEMLKIERAIYRKAEYAMWRNFAMTKKADLTFSSSRTATEGSKQAKIDIYKKQYQNYGNIIHAFYSDSPQYTLHTTYKHEKIDGFMPVARTYSLNITEMIIPPKECDILMFNMDPRSQSFAVSYKATAEELILDKISADTSAIEMLSLLGGKQPTSENDKPIGVTSRDQKQKEIEEREKQNKELELVRRKQLEQAQKQAEELKRKQETEKAILMEKLRVNPPPPPSDRNMSPVNPNKLQINNNSNSKNNQNQQQQNNRNLTPNNQYQQNNGRLQPSPAQYYQNGGQPIPSQGYYQQGRNIIPYNQAAYQQSKFLIPQNNGYTPNGVIPSQAQYGRNLSPINQPQTTQPNGIRLQPNIPSQKVRVNTPVDNRISQEPEGRQIRSVSSNPKTPNGPAEEQKLKSPECQIF